MHKLAVQVLVIIIMFIHVHLNVMWATDNTHNDCYRTGIEPLLILSIIIIVIS